jgi:hypothetical protein
MTVAIPKSFTVRVVEFFTEKFDAITIFITKWTF